MSQELLKVEIFIFLLIIGSGGSSFVTLSGGNLIDGVGTSWFASGSFILFRLSLEFVGGDPLWKVEFELGLCCLTNVGVGKI